MFDNLKSMLVGREIFSVSVEDIISGIYYLFDCKTLACDMERKEY